MKKAIVLQALCDKYKAEIVLAKQEIDVYFERPAGIGEHPDLVAEVEKKIDRIAELQERIDIIQSL